MKNIKLFTNIEKIHFVIFENTSKRNYNLRKKKKHNCFIYLGSYGSWGTSQNGSGLTLFLSLSSFI